MSQREHLTRADFAYLQDVSYEGVTIDQLRFSFHGLRYDYNRGFPVAPHMHEFYEFHYITAGSVKTTVNEVERTYLPGEYYLMTPMALHSHRYAEPPNNACESFALRWRIDRVTCEKTNPEMDLVKFVLEKAPPVAIEDLNDSIAGRMVDIIASAREKRTHMETMLKVVDLILFLSGQYAAMQNSSKPLQTISGTATNILLASIAFIDQHYTEAISASDVAEHVHISYSHLARLYAQYMNISVNAYIARVRIDRASHLLMTTDLSISQITQELGYSSISYFSNSFRRMLGQSPKEFRFRYKRKYFQGDPALL